MLQSTITITDDGKGGVHDASAGSCAPECSGFAVLGSGGYDCGGRETHPACSPSSGAVAHHPREHGYAQGIAVAIGLKMDRKGFCSKPYVTLWVGIGF